MSTINAAEKAKQIEAGFDPLAVSLVQQVKEMATFYNLEIDQVLYLFEIRALEKIGMSLMMHNLGKDLPALLHKPTCKACSTHTNEKPWPLPGEEE
ncbi:MAG: hypothetical protein F6K19_17325 [Cyanothece sp. SIO1E1]|nr:hypothetical protein [Cyanothece sp. SIO1E1]